MKYLRKTTVLIAMTIAGATAARATPLQTYTDVTSWLAAVTPLGDATFDGAAPSGGNPYVEKGVTFTGYLGSTSIVKIVTPAMGPWYDFGSGPSLATTTSGPNPTSIVADLPANINALALNVMVGGNPAQSVTVTMSDGSVFTVPTLQGQQSFVGATFSSPITRITTSIPGEIAGTVLMMDNFRFGTASVEQQTETPELATLLLIGGGLIGMAVLKKRTV